MAAAQCIIDRFYRGIQGKSAVLHVWESFIVQNRWTTLWFIAVLFLSELIFFLLVKLFDGNKKLLTAAVLVCATAAFVYYRHNGRTLPWNIDIFPVAILFMYIGYSLRDNSGFQKLMSSDTKRQLLFAGLFLLLNLILSSLNYAVSGRGSINMFYNTYGFELFSVPCAVFGVLFVLAISNIVCNKVINYIGKHSLVYFSLHQIIAIPVARACLLQLGLGDINTTVFNVLMLIISTSILTLASVLLYNTKLRVLLGKY